MAYPKVRGLGLSNNGPFWANYIHAVYLPQVEVLKESVFERLLPSFDGIEEEAERHGDEAFERRGSSAGYDADPADIAEAALEESIASIVHGG